MIQKRIKSYGIYLYDEGTQQFGAVAVEKVAGFQAAADRAASAYRWWKLCELAPSGGITGFSLKHPVSDCLPDIT